MRQYYGITDFYNSDPSATLYFCNKTRKFSGWPSDFKKVKITIELLEGFLDVAAVLETGVEVVNVEAGGGRHFTPQHRVPEQHQILHQEANQFFQLL
jgi:hypothetical protein